MLVSDLKWAKLLQVVVASFDFWFLSLLIQENRNVEAKLIVFRNKKMQLLIYNFIFRNVVCKEEKFRG